MFDFIITAVVLFALFYFVVAACKEQTWAAPIYVKLQPWVTGLGTKISGWFKKK